MSLEAPAHTPDVGTTDVFGVADSVEGRVAAGRPKVTRIVSAKTSLWLRLVEIWRSRELLVYLVRSEIKVKYKNSVLGLLWSMISPAMTLFVYTLVFGYFLKNGMPDFVLYLFSGLLLWNFFSTGVVTATGVIVNNAGLVKKVAFPREILALAAVGSSGVFFFFQCCVMVIFMVALQWGPAWSLLYLLVVGMAPTLVLACALAVLFAAVNVYMRDMLHLVTVVVGSAWFWWCPMVYAYSGNVAAELARHHLTWVYFLNPMTPPVMTFERVLYGHQIVTNTVSHLPMRVLPAWPVSTYLWADGVVLVVAGVLFYVAMLVFGRLSGNFAEEL